LIVINLLLWVGVEASGALLIKVIIANFSLWIFINHYRFENWFFWAVDDEGVFVKTLFGPAKKVALENVRYFGELDPKNKKFDVFVLVLEAHVIKMKFNMNSKRSYSTSVWLRRLFKDRIEDDQEKDGGVT